MKLIVCLCTVVCVMHGWSYFELRDWFEDELRAFQGGKDGLMPCVWENELSSFPQVVIIFLL